MFIDQLVKTNWHIKTISLIYILKTENSNINIIYIMNPILIVFIRIKLQRIKEREHEIFKIDIYISKKRT